MEVKNVIKKKDWKEEFVSKLTRERILIRIENLKDIVTFLNSYFEDLKTMMNEINSEAINYRPYDWDDVSDKTGMFYAKINGYKIAKIEYYQKRKNGDGGSNGIIIKTVINDDTNDIKINSREIAWLVVEDNIPYINKLDANDELMGEPEKLSVKKLDEIVEQFLMNAV